MIVLMAGLPASGKSTLCRALAQRVSGTVLDKDVIRAALFDPRDIEYSTKQDDFCMRVILETAKCILKKHPLRIVFIDGRPFSRSHQIDEVIRAATELKQEWKILECVCSEETARKRLAEPGAGEHPAANRTLDLYLRVKSQFEEIKFAKTVIDTEQALDVCVNRGVEALR